MPTFWDHLNNITYDKGPYLGDENWNISMINRYLSMDQDYCEIVNIVQKNFRYYSNVPNEVMYKAYRDLIPKQKKYLKYIKNENGKRSNNNNEDKIKAIALYFQISQTEAAGYIPLLDKTEIKSITEQINGK